MKYSTFLLALSACGGGVLSAPAPPSRNPFIGKKYFANSFYAGELEQTRKAFLAQNDPLNAARVKTVQKTGTFVWISSVSALPSLDTTITEARAEQRRTHQPQIVELVLYDLPDRDCSAGAAAGEFFSAQNGLELYKSTYVDPFAAKVQAARDLTFAVILEPDSLANVVTGQDIPFCANASRGYEEGIAYAISKLQAEHVALYVDAAHGGWLGWDGNLEPAAAEFAKVLSLARTLSPSASIRGFSTDVSNFNPYIAAPRANYTQYSNSYDELHYVLSLTPHLTNHSLPAHFIIDQGRSGKQNTRTVWGDSCNVDAGFGIPPTTKTNSTLVDSIVWVKPGGESDGPCGASVNGTQPPSSGRWWDEYAQMLVRNAEPSLRPTF